MKPTPGPWIVDTSTKVLGSAVVINADTREIVAVCVDMEKVDTMANAALISIAPEMMEALIAVQEAATMAMDGDLQGTLEAAPIAAMISDVFEKLVNEAGLS